MAQFSSRFSFVLHRKENNDGVDTPHTKAAVRDKVKEKSYDANEPRKIQKFMFPVKQNVHK